MGFWDRVKEQAQKDAGIIKTIKLEYLGGHPKIKGKTIEICETSNSNTLKINRSEFVVTEIDWDEKHSRSAGKAAAGAILGGLATGGIGLIAGAAIGGKKKDESTVTISVTEGSVSYHIQVRCNQAEFAKLSSML